MPDPPGVLEVTGSLGLGGVPTVVRDCCEALRNRGYGVDVCLVRADRTQEQRVHEIAQLGCGIMACRLRMPACGFAVPSVRSYVLAATLWSMPTSASSLGKCYELPRRRRCRQGWRTTTTPPQATQTMAPRLPCPHVGDARSQALLLSWRARRRIRRRLTWILRPHASICRPLQRHSRRQVHCLRR